MFHHGTRSFHRALRSTHVASSRLHDRRICYLLDGSDIFTPPRSHKRPHGHTTFQRHAQSAIVTTGLTAVSHNKPLRSIRPNWNSVPPPVCDIAPPTHTCVHRRRDDFVTQQRRFPTENPAVNRIVGSYARTVRARPVPWYDCSPSRLATLSTGN
jgi:hypothetical protein